jgi:cytochrome c55X
LAVVAIVFSTSMAMATEPIPAARQAALKNLLEQDCGSCHGLTRRGGLGPALLPEDVAALDDETLVAIILDGVPGTPMPPWRPLLTEAEAAWLADSLRQEPE